MDLDIGSSYILILNRPKEFSCKLVIIRAMLTIHLFILLFTGDYTKFRLQGPYLILSKEIDVDTEPSIWSLTVIVRDRGSPRLSALIDIVIFVEGVDDNAPVWALPENGNYVVSKWSLALVANHTFGYMYIQSISITALGASNCLTSCHSIVYSKLWRKLCRLRKHW